jgi:hypothetical protein
VNADQVEELGNQMRRASEAVEEVAVQLYTEANRLRTEGAEPRVPTGVNTAWRGSTVQTDKCHLCGRFIDMEDEVVLHFREPTDKVRWPVHLPCYLDSHKEPQHLPGDHPVRLIYEGIRGQVLKEFEVRISEAKEALSYAIGSWLDDLEESMKGTGEKSRARKSRVEVVD